jgi:hypothetical protein
VLASWSLKLGIAYLLISSGSLELGNIKLVLVLQIPANSCFFDFGRLRRKLKGPVTDRNGADGLVLK